MYRSAYDIWVKEIIFGKNSEPNEKLDLCSKIEAYSRELCGITDVLCILLYMLYFTLFVNIVSNALIMNYMNFNIHTNFANLTNSDKINFIQTVLPLALTMLVFFAMPFLILLLNLNILSPSKSSSIDEMLFDVWWKNKCHRCKHEKSKKNMQPIRLYELLDEKIKNGIITDYTDEEKELVKNLTKKKDVNVSP